MLGRKAILHTGRTQGSKRKWQVEQEKDSDAVSSDEEEEEDTAHPLDEEEVHPLDALDAAAGKGDAAPAENRGGMNGEAKLKKEPEEKEKNGDSDSDDEDDEKGGKAFAWMDSDDEVSEGEEDAAAKASAVAPKAPVLAGAATGGSKVASQVKPLLPAGAKLLSALRQPAGGFCPPLALPPGTAALPVLTPEHLALMSRIASARTLADFWDLAERRTQDFAASHAAFALHRLSVLAAGVGGGVFSATPAAGVSNHKSFVRLRDRLDELLATAKGRASFLPADLALAASSLAKAVPLPATEGATGRIFADIADEAESRILAEPMAFTTSMLADLAGGISKSGNSKTCFLRAIVDALVPRLPETTCQDIATLSQAFMEHTFDEAEVVLHGLFQQAKQRLGYKPPLPSVGQIHAAMGVVVAPVPAGLISTPAAASAVPTVAASDDGAAALVDALIAGAADAAAQDAIIAQGSSTNGSEPPRIKHPAWQLVGHWRFSTAQISDIICAASRRAALGVADEALFSLVAQQFISRMHEFNAQQLPCLVNISCIPRWLPDYHCQPRAGANRICDVWH